MKLITKIPRKARRAKAGLFNPILLPKFRYTGYLKMSHPLPAYITHGTLVYESILIHVVYSTKDRHPFLTEPDIRNELFHYIGGILRNNDAQPLGVNGFVDHVHMLFVVHPDCKIAQTIKETKRASSIWIKRKGERYQKFSWQTGYCALSVSESIKPRVQKYIDTQELHHTRISFHDEWMALMKANHFPLPHWIEK